MQMQHKEEEQEKQLDAKCNSAVLMFIEKGYFVWIEYVKNKTVIRVTLPSMPTMPLKRELSWLVLAF